MAAIDRRHEFRSRYAPFVLAACLANAPAAYASCGSAFCTLMTDRYAQGAGIPHTGWSVDAHLESIVQSQLRHDNDDLDASDVTGEEEIERRTVNDNFVTSLTYGIDADWSVSLRIPIAHRDHTHDLLDDASGEIAGSEEWRFTQLGDLQATVRRQFLAESGQTSYAVYGGLKLPSGAHDLVNLDGVEAERALQPGSGTTDLVAGFAARRAVGSSDALIAQASMSAVLSSSEAFEPGRRLEVSVGWAHAYSPKLGSVLQLNVQRRSSDSGLEAEPENSGSTTVTLSPGITVGAGHASTIYAYVQLPVHQNVAGVQLVPEHALSVGWTTDF
jgi:hypothetical protein